MKLRILALVFAIILVMCSCSSKDNTSSVNNNLGGISIDDNTSSYICQRPGRFGTFKYASLDEFVSKIETNGVEEFCDCKKYKGCQDAECPTCSPEYHHKRVEELFNAALYEVYYKGNKLDVYKPIGFNVTFTATNWSGETHYYSCCEYFIEYTDEQYGDCMKFLNFHSKRSMDFYFEDHSSSDGLNPDEYVDFKIQFHGKETECRVYGNFNAETEKWGSIDFIYLTLDDDYVVCFDAFFSQEAHDYLSYTEYQGSFLTLEARRKIYSKCVRDIDTFYNDYSMQDIENYLNSFEFKKVNITLPQ